MSSDSTPQGESTSPSETTIPMVTCRVCGTEVPSAVFCGFCGAHLSPHPGNGPDWLRMRAYAPAVGEHVLRLSVVSSLFPHLAYRSRAAFRTGFASLIVLFIVFALLRWQAPLVAVSSLGFAMLYLIFLEESDVYGDEDLPIGVMLLTTLLGVVLGVGWARWTGPIVANSYYTLGGLTGHGVLLSGVAIPAGGAVLMLLPALAVRMMRPRQLESLDGFLIGSLGAIAFTAAGTLTRLAPQLTSGLVASKHYVGSLFIEAGIQGVSVPVTAAAAGGLVGATLWHITAARPEQRRKRAGALLVTVLVVLVVYAVLGLADVARLWPPIQLILHLLIAALAILAVRIAVHLALLHEAREEMQKAAVHCAECHHIVPEMAFCPNCGTATRAASRSSRGKRRLQTETDDPTHPTTEQP
jgi:hypothetical protein